jgi:hypothetical protein
MGFLDCFLGKKDVYLRLFLDLKKDVFRWGFSKKTILDAFSAQKFCNIYCIHGSVVLNRLKFEQNHGHIENIYSKKSGAPARYATCVTEKGIFLPKFRTF